LAVLRDINGLQAKKAYVAGFQIFRPRGRASLGARFAHSIKQTDFPKEISI
jgi:hypothetical protein